MFPALVLHRDGLAPALAGLPDGTDVFLSIDVDGIDPSVVPCVILPAFGGLGYSQLLRRAAHAYRRRGIRRVRARTRPHRRRRIAIARLVSILAGQIARQRNAEGPR